MAVCFLRRTAEIYNGWMAHRSFDDQMEALDALKGRSLDGDDIALIRKMLTNKSNLLAAKAAQLAEGNELRDLLPDLMAAYGRFFANADKTDPQCWAKNAISRALSRLGCRDKDVFLRGLHHQQWEPTWGGRADSAGTLRANCAHALIGCEGLIAQDLVLLLLDLLADDDKTVRVEAVRALAQLDDLAVPILRLFALMKAGDPENTEAVSVCFSALLAIEQEPAIAFVARFLPEGNDAGAEAAFALADTHHPAALAALLDVRSGRHFLDPWFAGVVLSAIALTRLPQAADYLIRLIEDEGRDAEMAIEALVKSSPNEEGKARLEQALDQTGSVRLRRAYEQHS